jgi:hypothetical protein
MFADRVADAVVLECWAVVFFGGELAADPTAINTATTARADQIVTLTP